MVGLADMQTELRKLQGTFFCPKIPSRWPQVNPFFSLMLASFRTASRKQHNKIFYIFFYNNAWIRFSFIQRLQKKKTRALD